MSAFSPTRSDVAAVTTRRAPGSAASAAGAVQRRAATLQPASYDAGARTLDVVFTTGASVARSTYADGDHTEVLLTGPSNVRLGRLNAGAPLLDSHQAGGLATLLGAVVPGSARMEAGRGVASVRLSDAARAADTVTDIRDGVIRNISVGYLVHASTRSTGTDGGTILTVTDWEPVEISAVAVPADAGAQFRALPSSPGPRPSGGTTPGAADDPGKLVRKLADLGLTPSKPSGASPDRLRSAVAVGAAPSLAEKAERFHRALAEGATRAAPATDATTRRWAEAMAASGTLGTTEAGRALGRRLNLTTEPSR